MVYYVLLFILQRGWAREDKEDEEMEEDPKEEESWLISKIGATVVVILPPAAWFVVAGAAVIYFTIVTDELSLCPNVLLLLKHGLLDIVVNAGFNLLNSLFFNCLGGGDKAAVIDGVGNDNDMIRVVTAVVFVTGDGIVLNWYKSTCKSFVNKEKKTSFFNSYLPSCLKLVFLSTSMVSSYEKSLLTNYSSFIESGLDWI